MSEDKCQVFKKASLKRKYILASSENLENQKNETAVSENLNHEAAICQGQGNESSLSQSDQSTNIEVVTN